MADMLQNYIDGKFVAGRHQFADVNPADGSVIAQVTEWLWRVL